VRTKLPVTPARFSSPVAIVVLLVHLVQRCTQGTHSRRPRTGLWGQRRLYRAETIVFAAGRPGLEPVPFYRLAVETNRVASPVADHPPSARLNERRGLSEILSHRTLWTSSAGAAKLRPAHRLRGPEPSRQPISVWSTT